MKSKKCKVCGESFPLYRSTQKVCSVKCSMILSSRQKSQKAVQQAKARKVSNRAMRNALRPHRWYLGKAQAAFNSYVRARDYGNACISSGRTMNWNKIGGAVDAGHYRSTGSAPHLRFNLWNCHAQSVADNRHLSGAVVDYRIRLIEKIGIEKVEWLERQHDQKKFTKEYLTRVARIFRKKTRMMIKRRSEK